MSPSGEGHAVLGTLDRHDVRDDQPCVGAAPAGSTAATTRESGPERGGTLGLG
jgi:hypothetical protein